MQGEFHYLQHHALRMLTLAIYHGDLIPSLCCEKCGVESDKRKLDGHHEDYSKPLEVIWLCRDCHKKEHAKDGRYFFSRARRSAPKLQKALDYLGQNPDKLNTPPRDLEVAIGMSYGTIFRAQQQIKQSTNGHSVDSENEHPEL